MKIIDHGIQYFQDRNVKCPECGSFEYRINHFGWTPSNPTGGVYQFTCNDCYCIWQEDPDYLNVKEQRDEPIAMNNTKLISIVNDIVIETSDSRTCWTHYDDTYKQCELGTAEYCALTELFKNRDDAVAEHLAVIRWIANFGKEQFLKVEGDEEMWLNYIQSSNK